MVAQEGFTEEMRASAERGALLNAVKHGGKADPGAVIGRLLAEYPQLRTNSKLAAKEANAAVHEVNKMSPGDQEALLRTKYPEAQEEESKEGRVGLPPLADAVKGAVAFRLPPEPSGYMTIGHAMAFTINYLYKMQYDGKLWLRFEDTNPRKVALEYYESFRRGISWLEIKYDQEKNVSDDIPTIYGFGKKLIEQGDAYACSCDEAKVKRLRFDGVPCEHRSFPLEKSLEVWDGLVGGEYHEGDWVVRMKGDMKSANYSLRDTNLFRVIDKPHPLVGTKYSLWPTYDLANAVEDEITGITHVLRSSEFRNELQALIRDKLKFRPLQVIQFSRFNFKGTPVSKRLLRPLVEQNLVSGWDDPRMPTVDGLRRRGVIPQAIREFTLQVGYTKAEHEYDWSILLAVNRKLLDPTAKRIFFVPDPVLVEVEGAPKKKVAIPMHPQADLGFRSFETDGRFSLPGADLMMMKPGNLFRLMDLYNVEIVEGGRSPKLRYAGDELHQGTKKLQWVTEKSVGAKVLVPGPLILEEGKFNQESLTEVPGVAEHSLKEVKVGEIVQFPRFGFCRLDSPGILIFAS